MPPLHVTLPAATVLLPLCQEAASSASTAPFRPSGATSVRVDCERDRGVHELTLHVHDRTPRRQEQRGVRVAQAMGGEGRGQFRKFQDTPKGRPDIVRVDRPPGCCSEYQGRRSLTGFERPFPARAMSIALNVAASCAERSRSRPCPDFWQVKVWPSSELRAARSVRADRCQRCPTPAAAPHRCVHRGVQGVGTMDLRPY